MVVDILAESAGRPDALALITSEKAWTYADLRRDVASRAYILLGDGVEPGSTIPVVVESDPGGVVELLALWSVGAIPVPLNPQLSEMEAQAARVQMRDSVLPKEAQLVLWTSGTSGRPHGVVLSFGNLSASAQAAADRLSLSSEDVWLASLSMAHVGGLALVVRSLLLGGVLVAPGRFDVRVISDLLDGKGLPTGIDAPLTHMSLVPTQLLRLLDYRESAPPSSFKCALIGGAHAPARIVARALESGWPLALSYGATEMSSQIATAAPSLTHERPGTVGVPLAGVEVRIDGDGEISARGETRAVCYVGASKDVLSDEEGWYKTGDLGRFDEDGYLWITGRRMDRIVSGGQTIDAIQVEEALRTHPSVSDACVVGLEDEEWGEKIGAWIDPVSSGFDLTALETYLRTRLGGSKIPRVWHVESGLPRNANGKVDRGRVRAVLESD